MSEANGIAPGSAPPESPRAKRSGFLRRRLGGVAEAVTVLLVAATAAGLFGSLHWILDLCAHFRMQGAVAGFILGAALFLLRRSRFATLAFACGAIHFSFLVPFYLEGARAGDGDRPGPDLVIKAMLSNVNTRRGSPESVGRWIEMESPDLLVLQEIDEGWVERLGPVLVAYPHRVVRARDDNFGIGIFSRLPMSTSSTHFLEPASVPVLVAGIEVDGRSVQVIAAHPLPPIGPRYARDRDRFLAWLPGLVDSTAPNLLLGDLNTTRWGHAFRRLLAESGLRDSSEGSGWQPTWPVEPSFLRIPIDHCLHSPDLAIVSRRIGPDVGSDHFPLVIEVGIPAKSSSGRPESVSHEDAR